jgi:hypothetical protein
MTKTMDHTETKLQMALRKVNQFYQTATGTFAQWALAPHPPLF